MKAASRRPLLVRPGWDNLDLACQRGRNRNSNLFNFCKDHCPDFEALHSCAITADATGVTRFSCSYGRTCG